MAIKSSALLHRIPMQPWMPAEQTQRICSEIFADSPLKTDTKEFTYSAQNDFGRIIKKLLFCTPKEGFSSHFFENMKEIGSLEGFEVCASRSVYSVRDPKLRTNKDKFLEPSCSNNLPKALDRAYERSKYLKDHAAVLTENAAFRGSTIGTVALGKLHRRADDGLKSDQLRDSRLYFEGGDYFHLNNALNAPRFLFGEDLAVATHQILRMDKWFSMPDEENMSESYACEQALMRQHKDQVNRWYFDKKIPQMIQKKAVEISATLSDEAVEKVLLEMKCMGLLKNFKFKTDEDKRTGREFASTYLAQLNFVKSEIFPDELRCLSEQVFFLTQIAYHLDVLIAPGPKGRVFLQDFELCLTLLRNLKKNAKALGLSSDDLRELESFIETMSKLSSDLKPLMDKVKLELEKAGFIIIPAPGAFFRVNSKNESFNINFLNSISGYSPQTKHYYYAASGAQTKLGKILMDAYADFLKRQSDDIAVYFIGRNPNNDKDFSEAMADLNDPKKHLGPHCLSFELEIAPHTAK